MLETVKIGAKCEVFVSAEFLRLVNTELLLHTVDDDFIIIRWGRPNRNPLLILCYDRRANAIFWTFGCNLDSDGVSFPRLMRLMMFGTTIRSIRSDLHGNLNRQPLRN